MTLRTICGRTVARVRSNPRLLAGTVPLLVAAPLAVALVSTVVSGSTLLLAGGLGLVVWTVVGPLTWDAVGRASRHAESGRSVGPRELLGAVRGYPRAVGRRVAVGLVTLPLVPVALVLVGGTALAALTAVQAAGYALHAWRVPRPVLWFSAPLGPLFAVALATTPLRFATAVPLERRWFRDAASMSARAFSARPLTAVGVTLVETLLGLVPFTAALGASFVAPHTPAGVIGVVASFVCTGAPLFAARAVFHEEARRQVAAEREDARPVRERVRHVGVARLALVALVLGAVVAGGVAVRFTDQRPGSRVAATAPVRSGDVNADALVNESFDRVQHGSHVERLRRYNRSTGRVEFLLFERVEYPDGEFETYYVSRDEENPRNWTATGGYISRSTIASYLGDVRTDGRPPGIATPRRDDSWYVNVVNPYPVSPVRSDRLDWDWLTRLERGRWRVASRSSEQLVLRVTNYSTVARRDPGRNVNGSVRVVIDRKTGFVTRVEERWAYVESEGTTPVRRREVRTFGRYGTVDVTRPPAIGTETTLQLLADLLYY